MDDKTQEQRQYPISREEQNGLWCECWEDAKEEGLEFTYTVAKTQSLFQYRIGVLNDRILDHDMLEAGDEESGLLSEDG